MRKIVIIILISYAGITILSIRNELASDGYFEVGFPFVFYRTTHAKGDIQNLSHFGFFIKDFIIDIGILVGIIVVVLYLYKRIRNKV